MDRWIACKDARRMKTVPLSSSSSLAGQRWFAPALVLFVVDMLVVFPVAVFVVCAGTSAAVPSRKAPDRAA